MSTPTTPRELPEPLDLSHYFSRTTKARGVSKVKQFYKYFAIPGIGQLAGGLPNEKLFPYDTLEAQVALPNRWRPSTGQSSKPSTEESHLTVPQQSKQTDITRKIDLASALQYGQSSGIAPLASFVKDFALNYLHPTIPYKGGADTVLSCGAMDGFSKVVQCFNNEWSEEHDPVEEREGLVCEIFAFMNAIQTARPRGMNVVPIDIDDEGMLAYGPGGLKEVLRNWDFSRGKRPHLMYTVTVGQNPTGTSMSIQRKKEIYSVCQQYDMIIVEDDPYWNLQFPSSQKIFIPEPVKPSGYKFLDSMTPSYLSIDTDGRVVRLDTFSKTIAPGCRLGWLTASPAVIERITRITEGTTYQPSGFVQSVLAELLIGPDSKPKSVKDNSGWDMTGWVRWLEGLRGEYERRMIIMCDILDEGKEQLKFVRSKPRPKPPHEAPKGFEWSLTRKHDTNASLSPKYGGTITIRAKATPEQPSCPTCKSPMPQPSGTLLEEDWDLVEGMKNVNLYQFQRPPGGMFVWVEILFESHPLFSKVDSARLAMAMWLHWTKPEYKVLVSPGQMFSATPEIAAERGYRFFRLCFGAVPVEELADISKRFVAGVSGFWDIDDPNIIDDLLKDIEETDIEALQSGDNFSTLTGAC